jgi:chemotaxis protein methyltransferase CheR
MNNSHRDFEYTRRDFDYLARMANERTGIVVSDDKFDMFYSRLAKRVRKLGLKSFAQYCNFIRDDASGQEVLELVNAITTNLTSFFRENHHFEYVAHTLIPRYQQDIGRSREIKVWSAGCSTGEEPYSLAITFLEHLPPGWTVRITATDIDSNVLERAASGIYPLERVNGLPKARLKRWFQKGKGKHQGEAKVKPEVRQLIQFGQLNLMHNWSLDGPFDIIFCRNVIIYFDRDTKARLVQRYAEAIKPEGHLFIGHSESLYKISDQFKLIGNTVYQRV